MFSPRINYLSPGFNVFSMHKLFLVQDLMFYPCINYLRPGFNVFSMHELFKFCI